MPERSENMPTSPIISSDGLSAVLARLDLTAEIFMHADLCGQWAMDTSGHRKVPFHLIERGTAWLHTSDAEPRLLGSGDFVVFPHDAAHRVSSDAEPPPDAIVNQVPDDRAGRHTSLLCGFFVFRNRNAWPLLDSLPDVVVLDLKEGGRHNATYPLVQLMISELEQNRPGVGAALDMLACLLFIQVLRARIASGAGTGLLHALGDAQIGHALNLIHLKYGDDWSVERLAREVGMSRSVFSEKFSAMVGRTPMRYLGEWRMREAAELLRNTGESMADIAETVGYRSEIAFRKAFRNIMGEPPGKVRRGG